MELPVPKVGEEVYLERKETLDYRESQNYDMEGGVAKVIEVRKMPDGSHFLVVEEVPGEFRWEGYLDVRQQRLHEKYCRSEQRAHTLVYRPIYRGPVRKKM